MSSVSKRALGAHAKSYPIGSFQIDIAEVRTAKGKLYMLVAIGAKLVKTVYRVQDQAKARR